MKVNVGKVDRLIRIVLGVVFLSLLFFLEKPMGYIGLVGLIPVVTVIFRNCPLYTLFGLSTCPIKRNNY